MGFRRLPCVSLKIDGRVTPVRVYEAHGFFSRARGLLGSEPLRENEALWISPCGSVHTLGMRYAIDVVFLNRRREVVGVKHHVEPARFAAQPRAHSALELPAGAATALAIAPGAKLDLQVGQQAHSPELRKVLS